MLWHPLPAPPGTTGLKRHRWTHVLLRQHFLRLIMLTHWPIYRHFWNTIFAPSVEWWQLLQRLLSLLPEKLFWNRCNQRDRTFQERLTRIQYENILRTAKSAFQSNVSSFESLLQFTLKRYHHFLWICTYSSVPNRRACTFINFEKKFPPARLFGIKSSKLKTAYNPVKKSKFVINDWIEMSK